MSRPINGPSPSFDGQAVLGTYPPLSAALFAGTPDQADAWLGNAPGTTQYNPSPGLAVCGVITGPDAPTVSAAIAAIAATCTGPGILFVPSGISIKGWDAWQDCQLLPNGLAAAEPQPFGGGYAARYRAPFKRGTLLDSTGSWHPSLTGLMQPVPNGGPPRLLNDSKGQPIDGETYQ